MYERRTREDVRNYLFQHNYYLLEDCEYRDGKTPLSFMDKEGYLYYIALNHIIGSINSNSDLKHARYIKYNIFAIDNVKNWLKLNNKNFTLISDKFDPFSKTLWFHCNNPDCDRDFDVNWTTMLNNKSDCPFCIRPGVRSRLSDNNRLSVLRPDIAKEWNYRRNKKTPEEYTVNSNEKVWWVCEDGHEWEMVISKRTMRGQGCPTCAGKWVSDTNRLSILYPELCDEWDYDKNEGCPEDYSFGSQAKVGWVCPDCGNKYDARISHRTYMGSSCPACSDSCGEKKLRQILKHYGISFVTHKRFDDCRYKKPLPFDVAIPYNSDWVLIEYNGIQHYIPQQFGGISKEKAIENFNEQVNRDNIKRNYCLDNNIPFIEISYLDYDNIESILRDNSII